MLTCSPCCASVWMGYCMLQLAVVVSTEDTPPPGRCSSHPLDRRPLYFVGSVAAAGGYHRRRRLLLHRRRPPLPPPVGQRHRPRHWSPMPPTSCRSPRRCCCPCCRSWRSSAAPRRSPTSASVWLPFPLQFGQLEDVSTIGLDWIAFGLRCQFYGLSICHPVCDTDSDRNPFQFKFQFLFLGGIGMGSFLFWADDECALWWRWLYCGCGADCWLMELKFPQRKTTTTATITTTPSREYFGWMTSWQRCARLCACAFVCVPEATKKTEKHTAHSEKINLLSDDITKNVAAERLLLLLPLLTLSLSLLPGRVCVCVRALHAALATCWKVAVSNQINIYV